MMDTYKKHIDVKKVNRMAEQDPQGLIQLSEKRYRDQMAEIADRFAADFPQQRVILLSGPSSAGKTTTSHNLDTELEKRGISTFPLSLDDFFFDRDQAPLLPDGTPDLETPLLIDTETLEMSLRELFIHGSYDFPIFDFKTGKRSDKTFHYEYDDHTAIIIEGLHALNPLICERPFFKNTLKLYISLKSEYYLEGKRVLNTRDLRCIRRIIRDNSFRGCPPLSTIAMWDNVVRGEDQYIRPFRVNADYWIDSLHLYEPLLYKPLAEQLLTPCIGGTENGKRAAALLKMLEPFAELPPVEIPEDSLMREFLEEF